MDKLHQPEVPWTVRSAKEDAGKTWGQCLHTPLPSFLSCHLVLVGEGARVGLRGGACGDGTGGEDCEMQHERNLAPGPP